MQNLVHLRPKCVRISLEETREIIPYYIPHKIICGGKGVVAAYNTGYNRPFFRPIAKKNIAIYLVG